MKILFIADPLDSFKLAKDSTYAMMVEAAKRGHDLYFALQEGLMWKGGRVLAECSRISLTGATGSWYRADAAGEAPLAEFDAVLMRKDPPFDAEYVASTWLLELAQARGREGVQRSARGPRPQREAGDREVRAIHRADRS